MTVDEKDVKQVVNAIWGALVQLGYRGLDQSLEPTDLKENFVGCVEVTGDCEGAFTITMTPTLARRVAGQLFRKNSDDITEEEARDTVAELTNILSGNLRSVLPGDTRQTLAECERNVDFEAFDSFYKCLSNFAFESEGQNFVVSALERTTTGTYTLSQMTRSGQGGVPQ